MDKFGIFNLLTSLLGGNNGNSEDRPKDGLINSQAEADTAPEIKTAETRARLNPLQNSMLLTMKNHDEFIKRVKDKQKTKK